ncbi:MAG: efflux RND transporter periplasmic adaptor subunit [Acidobacteriia bacterium]|nr:efflux RND transporter periplasmic adaptor subunit [Terriglobia bacterium]
MLSSKPIAAAVLLALSLTACRESPRQVEASAGLSPSVAVGVVRADLVELPSIYEAVGTVRARTSAVLASKIMGQVREVKVRTGDGVSPGQLLVVLDSRDLDAAWRQAQAAREEALSARPEVENAAAAAEASLELAKTTLRRMQELYDKKSISDQEYDEVSAKRKVAQANYDMTISRRAQVAAKVQQAEEAVAAAEVMRGYAQIHAPFAGTVTEKPVEPGSLATPGTPLLTIEQAGALRLEIPVEEGLLAQTRVGQPVTVKLDSLDRTLEARVSEIVPSVDPASRAFLVKIDLPAVPHLRAGVYGRAQFARGSRKAIVVPAAAVSEQGQMRSVMVADNGVARTRLVTTGQKQGDLVEILSGLHAGEQIVSPRPAGLADGARVETRP